MILEVSHIEKSFSIERGILKHEAATVKALDDVSFSVDEHETIGLVGESGSGKTTLAKVILGLIAPDNGNIAFNKSKITNFRKDVQIIFQNPYNSLNPKMRVQDAIAEPLQIHRIVEKKFRKEKVIELLKTVGLDEGVLNRLPRELSGGQRQRVCIARVLGISPKFLILDEPISSLDLTVAARMLDLFKELKEKFSLTYIFVSHNLAVIKHIAERVIVMRQGRIVEMKDAGELFAHPEHEYTRFLLDAARGK